MAAGGGYDRGMADRELKEIMHGIKLVLEEMRELRRESFGDRKTAAEDRRQATEDRRQAMEDRRQATEDRAWFRAYLEDARDREGRRVREQRARDRVIARIGNTIVRTQREHTQLLQQIARRLDTRTNGRGNGHGR